MLIYFTYFVVVPFLLPVTSQLSGCDGTAVELVDNSVNVVRLYLFVERPQDLILYFSGNFNCNS